jgi:hypothetical protein
MSDHWVKSASRTITPARINTSVPNPARVWDAMNGGHDNFEADRRVARHMVANAPALGYAGAAGWAFRRRVVSYLAGEVGVGQFLDISAGMRANATCNAHAVARALQPDCAVVYVANDPVVLSHARATLRSPAAGAIKYVEADPGDVESFLPCVLETLDLGEPVGVVMPDTLGFTRNAAAVVTALVAALPAGSYLAVIQGVADERLGAAVRWWNRVSPTPMYLRDAHEVAGWFTGCDILEPGVVEIHRWRPGPNEPDYPGGVPLLGAVARKR